MTIAVVDSGIDTASPEFAGRLSPDSTGFPQQIARCATCAPETVPAYPIQDKVGHGTEVASIAAAARNGSGIQGVAPEATILALKIVAADLNGVSPTSGPIPESNGVNTGLIAPAISYAVGHGAFVINLSVNGGSSGQVATEQRAAMDQVRAQDRLCLARAEIMDIVRWTEPTAMFGATIAQVTYRYRAADVIPLVPESERKALETPKEATVTLMLASDGWRLAGGP